MLRLEGLRAASGKVEALRGVSLEVRGGGLVTVIGANGAGKTSTLKTSSCRSFLAPQRRPGSWRVPQRPPL